MTKRLSNSDKSIEFDEVDYQFISSLGNIWLTEDGYSVNCNVANKTKALGRVLLNLEDSNLECDHKDRNLLNFKRDNLRIVTQQQQSYNRDIGGNNKSGFKGVYFRKDTKLFVAQIKANKKLYYLGQFKTAEEAAKVYDKKAIKLHGEFAVLNFPGVVAI